MNTDLDIESRQTTTMFEKIVKHLIFLVVNTWTKVNTGGFLKVVKKLSKISRITSFKTQASIIWDVLKL